MRQRVVLAGFDTLQKGGVAALYCAGGDGLVLD